MNMLNSNLWFISIATFGEAVDFTNWLRGKRKIFNDTMEFREWMESYKSFPLEIFMDGIHYRFKDRYTADIFLLGFEAALNIRLDNK